MTAARHRFGWQAVDVAFACVLCIDLGLEAAFASGVPSYGRLTTVLAAAPFAAPVAFRRRWPVAALLAGMTVLLIQQAFRGQLITTLPSETAVFVPILCAYGVGAWVEIRRGIAALVAATVLLYAVGVLATWQHASGAPGLAGSVALSFFFLIPAWVIGCLVREHGRRADAFAELELGALAERAQRERAAIAEERALIGRELQDIIAHSVSVMVVQAGGARRLLAEKPERARESILAVEHTGREALAEMRRLLGVLRRDDDPRALAPQPGLAQLDELIGQMVGRGMSCDVEGDSPEPLTPGIDLVAYRVVEAALVQAVDHGGHSARIQIRNGRRTLQLEILAEDTSAVAAADLRNVAERVALYDGQLEVLGEERQFVVRCQLPLAAAVPA